MARSGDGDTEYSRATSDQLAKLINDKEQSQESVPLIWGWDDADFKDDDKSCATIINKQQ